MRFLLFPLMCIAGLGLLMCAGVHLLALTNQLSTITSWLDEDLQMALSAALGAGIFVVWVPAVLIAQRINNGNRLNFSWKKVLAGCPDWMRYAAFTIFGYAFISFMLVVAGPGIDDEKGVRAFTGHGMAFYALAFSIFFSNWARPGMLRTRHCPVGHEVSHEDKFCAVCGLPAAQSGQDEA